MLYISITKPTIRRFEWTWTVSGVESQAERRFKFTERYGKLNSNSNGADTAHSLHTSVDRSAENLSTEITLVSQKSINKILVSSEICNKQILKFSHDWFSRC